MPALSQALEFITYTNTASVQVVYPSSATTTMVYYSDKVQGDGYFSNSDGLHTAMISTDMNFVGTATIQASLATNPGPNDWFDVNGTGISYDLMDPRTSGTVDCVNFTGNFVWVRGLVQIDRGVVESILVNH